MTEKLHIMVRIKENRKIINNKIPANIPSVKRQFLLREREKALEERDILYLEHLKFVRDNAVNIFFVGKNSKKIAQIAKEQFDCVRVDLDEIVMNLAKKIPKETYSEQGLSGVCLDFFVKEIEDLAYEHGILSYQYPVLEHTYNRAIKDVNDLAALFWEIIVDKLGGVFLAGIATSITSKYVINLEQKRNRFPIAIHTKYKYNIDKVMKECKEQFKRSYLITTDGDPMKGLPLYTLTRVNSREVETALKAVKRQYSMQACKFKIRVPEALQEFKTGYIGSELMDEMRVKASQAKKEIKEIREVKNIKRQRLTKPLDTQIEKPTQDNK